MERELMQFLFMYKWSIIGFLSLFTMSILSHLFGFWSAVGILFISLIGLFIGYVKDKNVDVMQVFRNLK